MSILLALILAPAMCISAPRADAEAPPPPEEQAWGAEAERAQEAVPICIDENAPFAEAWVEEMPAKKAPVGPSVLGQQVALDLMRSKAQAWRDCTVSEARDMAIRSREPAETIATAAMAMCAEEYRAMDISAREAALMFSGGGASADGVAPRHRENWRGSLLAFVIKWRQ